MIPDVFVPPPGHPLARHVAVIFRMREAGSALAETMLPAPTCGVIFNLGDRMRGHWPGAPDATMALEGPAISGVRMAPFTAAASGRLEVVGAVLRAQWAAEVLPVPLAELTDRSVDAPLVLAGAAQVTERLAEAASFDAQRSILCAWLLSRLRRDARSAAVAWACGELRRHPAEATVGRVARDLGVSGRHLRRLFSARVGVSPASYARLARFEDALDLMHRSPRLTRVAHAARYFDQPHFCREFRSFALMTPQDYMRARSFVPGHLYSRAPHPAPPRPAA